MGSRTKSLSALGGFTQRPWQDESIRARRGQKICPASQRALFEPVHRHDRSSTLAKFPANSLLLVEKFPASCSKIPCSVVDCTPCVRHENWEQVNQHIQQRYAGVEE